MTVLHAGPAVTPVPPQQKRAVTIPRLVHAEWTKFRTVRSLRLTLLLTFLLVVVPGLAVAAATVVQLDTLDAGAREGFNPTTSALSGVSLGTIAAGILGVLMMGGEYATGSIRTLLVVAPRRWDALLAKAIVLCGVVFPAAAVTTALTYVVAQRILAREDLDAPINSGLLVTSVGAAFALTTAALLGLALATLVRRTTGAATLVIATLLILPTLAGLVPGAAGRRIQDHLPSAALDRLSTLSPTRADQAGVDSATARWAALNAGTSATGGFTVAVVREDGTGFASAAGAAPDGTALADDSLVRMGSVTKSYVAAALLAAQAEGLVDLDAPVSRYVTDVPGAPEVTVSDLLALRSGIPDYLGGDAWLDAMTSAPEREWSLRDVLTLVPDGVRAPGQFEYSNTNYILAALVLERVHGTDWRTAVRELVLDPMELTDTHMGGEGLAVVAGTLDDGSGARVRTDAQPYTAIETSAAAAGSMVSTAQDLARFGRALLDRDLTPRESWQQMTAFGPSPAHYGLGLADLGAEIRRSGNGGAHALGNNGEIPGYGATLLLYPDSGISVAVMRNDDDRIDAYALSASIAADLGIDHDPDEWTGLGAALLALVYLLVLGGAAAAAFTRRDA